MKKVKRKMEKVGEVYVIRVYEINVGKDVV
jgi:hypothetical protein